MKKQVSFLGSVHEQFSFLANVGIIPAFDYTDAAGKLEQALIIQTRGQVADAEIDSFAVAIAPVPFPAVSFIRGVAYFTLSGVDVAVRLFGCDIEAGEQKLSVLQKIANIEDDQKILWYLPWLTVPEYAKRARMTPAAVYAALKAGRLISRWESPRKTFVLWTE